MLWGGLELWQDVSKLPCGGAGRRCYDWLLLVLNDGLIPKRTTKAGGDGDFPGGPVAGTLCLSPDQGVGSIPGQETKRILHAHGVANKTPPPSNNKESRTTIKKDVDETNSSRPL